MKKIVLGFYCLFLCSLLFGESIVYDWEKFGGDARIQITVTGNNIFSEEKTTTYFKDSVDYSYTITDASGKEILGIGNTVRYTGSGNGTIQNNKNLEMVCTQEKWVLIKGWIYKDSTSITHYFIKDNISPYLTINTSNYYSQNRSYSFMVSASDNGSGVDKIYYVIDNGSLKEVEANSATISVNGYGNHTVRVYVTDKVGNKSAEYTKRIYLDNTPPETPIVVMRDNTGLTYTSGTWKNVEKIIFTLSGDNDSGTYQKKTENGEWVDCNSTVEVSNEGTTSISFRSKDKAENVSTASTTYTVNIDRTIPETPTVVMKDNTGSTYASGVWKSVEKIVFSLSGDNDSGTYQKKTGNGDWVDCNSTVEIAAEGTTGISFRSKDKAGNVSAATTTYTVNIDRTVPETPTVVMKDNTGSTYASGVWKSVEKIVFTLSGDNDSGTYQKKTENGEWVDCNSTVEVSNEGTTSVSFRSKDKAGNVSAATTTYTVNIDRTVPKTPTVVMKDNTGSTYASGEWKNVGKIVFTLSGDNDSGIYQKKTGSGDWEDCTSSVEITTEGTTDVSFRSKDKAGNISAATTTYTVKLDRTEPTIPTVVMKDSLGVAYTSGTWKNTEKIVFTLSGDNDGGTYQKKTGSGDWEDCTSSVEITTEGTTDVSFRSKDKAGNVSAVTTIYTVNIDRTAPNNPSIILQDENGIAYISGTWTNSKTLSIIVNATDALSGINNITIKSDNDLSVEAKKQVDGSYKAEITSINNTETIHTITITASDIAENTKTITKKINIDRKAPVIPTVVMNDNTGSTYASGEWKNVGKIVFTLSGDNDSGIYQKKTGSGDWEDCTSTVEVANEGTTSVSFRSKDKAGNVSTATTTYTVNIDRTAPKIPIVEMKDSLGVAYTSGTWKNTEKIIFTLSGDNDSGTYQKKTGNGDWVDCTSTVEVANEGTTSISFRNKDKAGNVSTATMTYTVNIDRTVPKTPTIVMKDNAGLTYTSGTWNNTAKIIFTLSGDNDSGTYQKKTGNGNWENCTSTVEIAAEGTTGISFRSKDKAGNVSAATTTYTVNIDRTIPEINKIVCKSNNRVLSENNLIYYSYVNHKPEVIIDFDINAVDNYTTQNELNYIIQVNNSELITRNNQKFTIGTLDTENRFELNQGKNTVTIIAVDKAGNKSAQKIINLIDNKLQPSAPQFLDYLCSHKKAEDVNDAVANKDVKFGVTSLLDDYGIESYEYSIAICDKNKTIKKEIIGNTIIDSLKDAKFEIKNLDDNNENEFYLLSIRSKGKNGKYSATSNYPFRIDTTPPYYLAWMDTHSSSNSWYSNKKGTLRWIEKEDPITKEKTGVKSYYYKILPFEKNKDYSSKDLSDFNLIEAPLNNSYDISFNNDGEYIIIMAFEDYVGNIELDYSHPIVRIDTKAPTLKISSSNLIKTELEDGKLILENVLFTDDVDNKQYSGLKNIEIIYSRLKGKNEFPEIEIVENKKIFPISLTTDGLYVIEDEGIRKNESYIVNIICYDNAIKNNNNTGNYKNYNVIVYGTNKQFIEVEQIRNYVPENTNDGFKIKGTVLYDIEKNTYSNFVGDIFLPEDLNATIKLDGNIVNKFVPKSNEVEFNENVISLAKSDNSNSYSVKIDDIDFTCDNIGYSISDGLVFYNLLYNQILADNSEKIIKFNYGNAQINPKLKLNTSVYEDITGINIKESNSVYIFNNVGKIQFVNGVKNLLGTNLKTVLKFSNPNVIINRDSGNTVFLDAVTVTNASLNSNFSKNNNTLHMNEVKYMIEEASIIDDDILIKKASTILSMDNKNYKLILNDFKINSEGKVNKDNLSKHIFDLSESGKEVSEISDGTVTIVVDNITLDDDGHLLCDSGKYKNSFGTDSLIIKQIEIKQDSFDYSNSIVSRFVFNTFDYTISAEEISATKDYIIIKGTINVWDNDFSFNNLRYCPSTGKILNEVVLYEKGGIELGTFTKNNNEYGTAITYTNIKIKTNGIHADLAIPIPGVANNTKIFRIADAKLNSKGAVDARVFGTAQDFTYGTYGINATELSFDGSKVTVVEGIVDVKSKGFSNENVLSSFTVKNLSFNYLTEKTSGIIQESNLKYNNNGWKLIYIENPILSEEGILGSAKAERIKGNYLVAVEFIETSLNSRNEIVCRNVTGSTNLLEMNGISFTVNNALIENKIIKIYSATGTVKIGERDFVLKIENIELSEEGNINFTEGVSKVSSIDSNVTTITDGTAEIKIDNLKISEKGELYGETGTYQNKNENSLLTFAGKIKVNNDSFDYSAVKINPFDFSWKGYAIKSLEATACKEYVTITRGTGIVHGKTFSFKNIEYIPISGEIRNEIVLYESDGTTLGNLVKDIKGYGTTVKYTNIKIKPEGIYADAEITLPGALNEGKKFNIQSVKIHSNGNIETRATEAAQKFIYGTYEITASIIAFDGSKVTVEKGIIDVKDKGFSNGNMSLLSLTVENLSFNYNKNLENGSIINTQLSYTFDGWNFNYSDTPVLTIDGIKGKGNIRKETEEYIYKFEFSNFVVNADKVIDSGNAENGLESNYFIKNNYLFKLNDASFVKNNNKYVLKSNNPKIDVNTYNSLTLVFGETLINSDSTIISSEKGIQVPGSSFISANGYIINVTTAELNNKEIKLNGTLSTDELKSISQFNSSEMSLYSDFVVETTKNDESSIIYQYNGWTIYGTDVEYHYDRIIINKNKVNFRGVDIELGKLEFNSYYELEKSTTNVQNIPVSLLSSTYTNSDSIIKYTKFTDEGLVASIDVTLPNPFNNCTIRFDEVYLQSDNNFYVKTIKQRKEFNITESFKVELQDIILGSFGLKAGYISFTLPPINPNDSPVIISLQGLEVLEKNGNLKILIEGSAISPFTIFDTTFGIQNFSISENGYSFTGYTILPSKLPGVLSGMMIGIDKFNIGLNGEITHMGIKLVGTYTIPMGEGFSLNVSNITLDIESVQNEKEFVLLFDDAYLLFPPEYKIQNVKVQNIKYNITKKDFDFDNIKADTAFDAEISGIKFILSQLQIKKNKEESCYDISLYANAEFGKDFPLFLQKQENGVGPNVSGSVTFSTNKLKILKEIEVNASNLNGPITKENNLLNLKDGSAKINISGDKGLVVGILGKLEFTENAPDGIKGLTVDIEKFEFDGSKPAITEMKAKGMFETINISNVELKNLTAEIDYNETKQQEGFVSFSGKLKIPDVLPNETTTNGNNKIGGSVIDIKKFKIGFNSTVEFAASYNCESSVTIGEGLILSNITIGINYENKKLHSKLQQK